MQVKKVYSIILSGITIGFIYGFTSVFKPFKEAFSKINSNQYIRFGMERLTFNHLQDPLFTWMIRTCAGAVILFIIYLGWRYGVPQSHFKYKIQGNITKIKIKYLSNLNLYSNILKKGILFLFIILVILNLTIFLSSKIPSKNPNVILIVVDTLRADHMSCYGYSKQTTPHLDALSKDSILFKNAISQAPWTSPSVASLLTSKYPSGLGFKNHPIVIKDSILSLTELFKENNYQTKGIVSHVYLSSKLGFDQGFDEYDEENSKGHGHISSPSIVQKAVTFLEKNKNNKFFLFLHFFDPHYDYILHEKYNYYPDYKGPFYSGQSIKELRKKASSMTSQDINYIKALYDSEIRFTDEHIGKLINKLKELELYKKTMIILTADHGEEFLEREGHWIGHTLRLYQELIHVPLIIKQPENSKSKIVEKYTGLVDLMPTIVDYLGFRIPKDYTHAGKLINLSGMNKNDKIILSETKRWASLQSLIWKEWKLIVDTDKNKQKLFNLEKDPSETKNVVNTNKKIAQKLDNLLQMWKKNHKLMKTRRPKFTEEQKKRLKSLGYIK